MTNQFTSGEIEGFHRNGYGIARQLVDADTVRQMRALAADHVSREVPPIEYEADLHYPGAPASLEAQGGHTVRRLKQALSRGYVFTEWMMRPGVLQRLQQLVGERVVCPLAHHNCIMTKQPRFSSDTGWHQDIRYWSFQRPDLVSAWLALGDERPGNGGLWLIPGSHRMTFEAGQFDADKFFRTDLPQNAALIASRQSVELSPGDVLFFHCLTLHAASRNQGVEPKLSVVFTFRPADNLPLPGSRSAASPELWLNPV